MNEKMIDAGRHDVAEFMSMYPGACPVIKNGELVPDYSQPAPKDRIELDSIARNLSETRGGRDSRTNNSIVSNIAIAAVRL